MPERFKVVCTMQGAIQVLSFTLPSCDCNLLNDISLCCVAADDHETDYEFGAGSDDDDQIGDGEPR